MSAAAHIEVMQELIIQAIKLASKEPHIACADHLLDALHSLHSQPKEGETQH
jgi:hypothetical protein